MIRKLAISGIVLGTLILIQATSCDKDQVVDTPNIHPCQDSIETLPPKTQSGMNTAGCLIDDEIWVARNEAYFETHPEEMPDNEIEYGKLGNNPNNPVLKIQIWRYFSNSCDTALSSINIGTNNVKLRKELPIRNNYVFHDSYNCADFDKIPSREHYIIVDYLDTVNHIIAGRFAFTAVNHCTPRDTVEVTNGRFDVVYEEFD